MYNLNLCEDPTAARAHKGGWWAKDATEDSWTTENKASKKKEGSPKRIHPSPNKSIQNFKRCIEWKWVNIKDFRTILLLFCFTS